MNHNKTITMLWEEHDPKKTFSDILSEARAFYEKKYGQTPDTCVMNLDKYNALVDGQEVEETVIDGFVVTGKRIVRPPLYHISNSRRPA